MSVLVSILIPAHQSALTIRAALESCVAQTYKHLEIIVLNSSSGDQTAEIIRHLNDNRIILHESSEDKGIAASRNQLLRLAKGEFIAWLDADDIMMNNRIERQLSYFSQYPMTDIAGSWIRTDNSDLPEKKLPVSHTDIYYGLWFKNCMVQPSVMSRNFYKDEDIFYNEQYANTVEDYELWFRLRDKKHFANIAEFLTLYHMTIGEELEKKKKAGAFDDNLKALWLSKWKAIATEFNETQKAQFVRFLYNNERLDKDTFKAIRAVLRQLKRENNHPSFQLILKYHYLRLWRNTGMFYKMIYAYDLRYLSYWPCFKKHFLI